MHKLAHAVAYTIFGVIVITAAFSAWKNRRKYSVRERKRTAQGGLE